MAAMCIHILTLSSCLRREVVSHPFWADLALSPPETLPPQPAFETMLRRVKQKRCDVMIGGYTLSSLDRPCSPIFQQINNYLFGCSSIPISFWFRSSSFLLCLTFLICTLTMTRVLDGSEWSPVDPEGSGEDGELDGDEPQFLSKSMYGSEGNLRSLALAAKEEGLGLYRGAGGGMGVAAGFERDLTVPSEKKIDSVLFPSDTHAPPLPSPPSRQSELSNAPAGFPKSVPNIPLTAMTVASPAPARAPSGFVMGAGVGHTEEAPATVAVTKPPAVPSQMLDSDRLCAEALLLDESDLQVHPHPTQLHLHYLPVLVLTPTQPVDSIL